MTVTPDSAHTHAEWQELAAAVVNKTRREDPLDPAAAEASMRTTLPGGLVVDPLYLRPERPRPLGVAAAMPFTRGRAPRNPLLPWDVRQLHDDPDAATSAKAVLTDLHRGVTSIWLHVGADGIASSDVGQVLDEVMLHLAPVVVSSWDDQTGAAAALLELVRNAPEAPADGTNLGLDPIGAAARVGGEADLSGLAATVRDLEGFPSVRAMTVDTRPYADAGASAPQEVGMAIATAIDYLRHLQGQGIDSATAFGQIDFRVTATADQFLTTAKLRALRRLWARVGEVCEVPETDRGARTHAITAPRMFSLHDPWVNVLRSTLATFGASVGGADAITVLPYDTAAGLPTPFSRRLARNTQLLLSDESNVAKVTDPAGGSWYLESLTEEVAQRAWAVVQEIEAVGGMTRALGSGEVARRLAEAEAAQGEALAHRTAQLTGVSMFPILDETPTERRARAVVTVGEGALPIHRDADVFEALRARSAAYAKEHGAAPVVTLLPLGTRRQFGAREMWAMNLLAVAGIRATSEPTAGPIAIIASDKSGYAEFATDAVADLRAAGVERVLVAGDAGRALADPSLVDGEIVEGMDIVAFLSDALDRFGAPADPTTKGASA